MRSAEERGPRRRQLRVFLSHVLRNFIEDDEDICKELWKYEAFLSHVLRNFIEERWRCLPRMGTAGFLSHVLRNFIEDCPASCHGLSNISDS